MHFLILFIFYPMHLLYLLDPISFSLYYFYETLFAALLTLDKYISLFCSDEIINISKQFCQQIDP